MYNPHAVQDSEPTIKEISEEIREESQEAGEEHKDDTEVTESNSESIVIYRSPFDEAGKIFLLIVAYIMAIYLSVMFPVTVQRIDMQELTGLPFSFSLPLFGLIPLMLMGSIVYNLMNYRYVLTDDYVMEVEGLLTFREKSVRIHYIHIRGIEIEKTFIQKFFDLGNLRLGSAVAQGDSEIVLQGIRNPDYYKDIINAKIMNESK